MADDLSFDQFIPKKDGQDEISFDQFIPKKEASLSWSDVPLAAAKNFLPDVGRQAAGFAEQAAGVLPYAKYGPGAPIAAGIDLAKAIYNNPDLIKQVPAGVWKDLVDHYGSEEALKHTMANEPARFAMDVASVVGGGEALLGRRFARVPEVRPPPLPETPAPGSVAEAQQTLKDAGIPLDVPRAVTSENRVVKAGAQALSKAPIVGAPLRAAVEAVPEQMGAGVEKIAQDYGAKMPENIVGGGIERTLSSAAEKGAAAREAAQTAADEAAAQKWETENQARERAINERDAQATAAAERAFGNVEPMEMAQDTINDVQSAHRQARARKDALYADVNNLDARVKTSAFSDLRQRAEQALVEHDFDIDNPGSNASKMLAELDRLSGKPGEAPPNVPDRVMRSLRATYGDNIPADAYEALGHPGATDPVPPDFRMAGAHAPPPGADAISVQGLDHLSKRLGRMGMGAETPSDRYASRIIKNAFDDWRNDALGTHLTPDSAPNAGPVIDAARAAHRDLMQRFGYNYAREAEGEPRRAAKILNQIVTGGTGPEALRDHLIGAKPGNRPVSAPLYERIRNAVANPDELRARLRGAYWNAVEGSPKTVARNVEGLTPTRMGAHLFEPNEHQLMRGYADLRQQTPELLKQAAREARANKPTPTKLEPGKDEQLAKRVLGRNRSDEAVFGKIDTAMRKGGDIKEAARAWGKMSEANRDEFRGAVLRKMGGGETFNVKEFVKNWNDYSDQAKSFMFSREHRQNLDAIHRIATEYADTISKYGNPSGTAQVQAWHRLARGAVEAAGHVLSGAIGGPFGVAASGIGAYRLSKLLARPEGAQQIRRWSNIADAYRAAPSPAKLALLSTATRSLDRQ